MIPPVVHASRAQAEHLLEVYDNAPCECRFLDGHQVTRCAGCERLLRGIEHALEAAVEAEREACEKIAREHADERMGKARLVATLTDFDNFAAQARGSEYVADQIRARRSSASGAGEET